MRNREKVKLRVIGNTLIVLGLSLLAAVGLFLSYSYYAQAQLKELNRSLPETYQTSTPTSTSIEMFNDSSPMPTPTPTPAPPKPPAVRMVISSIGVDSKLDFCSTLTSECSSVGQPGTRVRTLLSN